MPRHSSDRLYAQKGGRVAAERDEFLRATWRVMVAAVVVEPEGLLFVDECGTHTSLAPTYGYAPRGERLWRAPVPAGAPRPRQEHDGAFEHERGGDGTFVDRRRVDHRPRI